ncbi:unnamed protein product [Hydatigera taeniaeformis]|uniref:Uncharacterized protein n=1 Tax=Hydatigena taeniaeformis TaxID=6205 RepID=A0A0R3WY64_HYDTA|nr:unnamed protein product [Hydatigera taeniaeformis]
MRKEGGRQRGRQGGKEEVTAKVKEENGGMEKEVTYKKDTFLSTHSPKHMSAVRGELGDPSSTTIERRPLIQLRLATDYKERTTG